MILSSRSGYSMFFFIEETHMTLALHEEKKLIALLAKVQWPVSPVLFEAWYHAGVMVAVELAVLNEHKELLLIRRKDRWYDGWHLPGTIMRPGDSVLSALKRLEKEEVGDVIVRPKFAAYTEYSKKENPRGQCVALLHTCTMQNSAQPRHGKFFPLKQARKILIPIHLKLLKLLRIHRHV